MFMQPHNEVQERPGHFKLHVESQRFSLFLQIDVGVQGRVDHGQQMRQRQ